MKRKQGGAASKRKAAKQEPVFYHSAEKLLTLWTRGETKYLHHFKELVTRGFTVIPGVCPELVKGMRENLELVYNAYYPGFKFAQPETWTAGRHPGMHGLVQWGDFGHIDAVWQARLAALPVFADLWGCRQEELLVSFDALNIGVPKSEKNRWMHFDQGWHRRGIWTVQGLIAITDQSAKKGCLQVFEKSHLLFDQFVDERKKRHDQSTEAKSSKTSYAGDWISGWTPEEYKWVQERCPLVSVEAKKGDLVLWLSTTAHQGHLPDPEEKEVRLAIYVACQQRPAEQKEKKAKQKKKEAKYQRPKLSLLAKKRNFFLSAAQTSHSALEGRQFQRIPYQRDPEVNTEFRRAILAAAPKLLQQKLATPTFQVATNQTGDETNAIYEAKSSVLKQTIDQNYQGEVPSFKKELLPINLQSWPEDRQRLIWRISGF